MVREGVHVIYDIESETTRRTIQYETRLGCWDQTNVYKIRGITFGVKFSEEEIAADGLVQYVHLEQVDTSNSWIVIPTSEQLIDELLANGWSLADG